MCVCVFFCYKAGVFAIENLRTSVQQPHFFGLLITYCWMNSQRKRPFLLAKGVKSFWSQQRLQRIMANTWCAPKRDLPRPPFGRDGRGNIALARLIQGVLHLMRVKLSARLLL